MASSKELQHSSRPSQHRLSMSTSTGSSLPSVRQSHSRTHSHSVLSGSLIPNHRVTRRKSVSSNAANNVAAMAAAVRENGDISTAISISARRNTMSKGASARSALGIPSPPASLPGHRINLTSARKADREENAIEDDDDMEDEEDTGFSKSRMRRSSEGQQLSNGKKASANDLKCEKCGKGYKHSSCLTKHLWEHTPEWSYTSKLLISKHQQVQLLEAASVLVTMNQDGTTPPDSAKDFHSDQESASPATSGSSDQHDRASSADTTPPPQGEAFNPFGSGSYSDRSKRYSSGSGFSRSYQSASNANPFYAASVPAGNDFGHNRQPSHERRPPSSGFNRIGQEDDQIAAAFDLLSCSQGSMGSTGMPRTPRTLPVTLPEDAPPVPTIPEKFLSGTHFSTLPPSRHPRQTESYTRHRCHADEDVKMEESEESVADDEDYDRRSRSRSDEDDEGVFGRMEE